MHPLIENYLHQVRKQLEVLPLEKQDEEIEELRQHLQRMVVERHSQGASQDEAVTAVLRQFGDSRRYASELREALGERRNTLLQNLGLGIAVGIGLLLWMEIKGFGGGFVGWGSPVQHWIVAAVGGALGGVLGNRLRIGKASKVSRPSLVLKSLEIGLRVALVGWCCGVVGGAFYEATSLFLDRAEPYYIVPTWSLVARCIVNFANLVGLRVAVLGGVWGVAVSVANSIESHLRKSRRTQLQ